MGLPANRRTPRSLLQADFLPPYPFESRADHVTVGVKKEVVVL
jgi:hypothetical protein